MKAWSLEELALLWRHSNAEVAEITGHNSSAPLHQREEAK